MNNTGSQPDRPIQSSVSFRPLRGALPFARSRGLFFFPCSAFVKNFPYCGTFNAIQLFRSTLNGYQFKA